MQDSLRFGFVGTDQPAALRRHRSLPAEAWRIELTTARTIMGSYKVLRARRGDRAIDSARSHSRARKRVRAIPPQQAPRRRMTFERIMWRYMPAGKFV